MQWLGFEKINALAASNQFILTVYPLNANL